LYTPSYMIWRAELHLDATPRLSAFVY